MVNPPFRTLRLHESVFGSFLRSVVPARYRPVGYLQHLARARTGCCVCAGPFAGMRYLHESIGSAYIPKLLGIYEKELAQEIETICTRVPDLVVDIGAAEGYYAVGLAMRIPAAKVVAFETEPAGQKALRELAALNQVASRVECHGTCQSANLAAVLNQPGLAVVICDVEGGEERLLDPTIVPALAKTTILVELHEFIIPGITDTLRTRFRATHYLRLIWQQPRSRRQFPWRTLGTTLLPRGYLEWSVSEWRPERMSWLWMEPYG